MVSLTQPCKHQLVGSAKKILHAIFLTGTAKNNQLYLNVTLLEWFDMHMLGSEPTGDRLERVIWTSEHKPIL